MIARTSSILVASIAMTFVATAQDARNFSYQSAARTQSAEEIEDLGEIAAADPAGRDGKSIPDEAPMKRKFRFSVTTRGDFTTNARLSGDHGSADFIGQPTVEAGYNVALGKYFTFDLAGRIESAIYGDNGTRSFIGYSANATLDFRPRAGLPRIYVSAEPYRYDNFDLGDSLTQALGLAAGTDWGYGFNNGRSLLFVGYQFAHYFADPSIDDRNTHRIVVGLAHQFRSDLTGQVFYSWQHNNFVEVNRRDSRHMVGASLLYSITDRWFGSLSTSFVDNDSNAVPASYQSFNTSLGLTLQF